MAKLKLQIKSVLGNLVFEYEKEDNTIKDTLLEAIKSGANLSGAYLSGAYLSGANLSGAYLSGANLSGANADESTSIFFSQCPDGEFIGWKKVRNNKIVKLLITEDAKRSSATTLKCRCSKAIVLDIQEIDGSKSESLIVRSKHDEFFTYEIGKEVSVDNYDENRWNECSAGIHFFISREMAVLY